jgi:hypothetical protein
MKNSNSVLVGESEKMNHSEDLGTDGKLILDRIFGNWSSEFVDLIYRA